jgi:hypothetical protein
MVNWAYLVLFLAAAVAVGRIYAVLKRVRNQRANDWDEQLVKNLRAQGGDPFQAIEVDFFFGAPTAEQGESLAAVLRPEGFAVDVKHMQTEGAEGYSVHALKALRVTVPEMQGHSARFRILAQAHGCSYDGWAAAGITRQAADNRRLRPRGVSR